MTRNRICDPRRLIDLVDDRPRKSPAAFEILYVVKPFGEYLSRELTRDHRVVVVSQRAVQIIKILFESVVVALLVAPFGRVLAEADRNGAPP